MKEQAGTAEQELEGEPRAACRESIPQVEILRVEILGVRVDAVSLDELMAIAGCWAEQDRRRTILYVNAHCLNVAARDCAYRELLNSADLVYADGIGAVLAGRMLNVGIAAERLTKITGADWIDAYCKMAAAQRISTYVIAGKPGVAEAACRILEGRYPDLPVAGSGTGYDAVYDAASSPGSLVEAINRTGARVVLVGMGVPLQEKWLAAWREQIDAPLCWGVGALFDYVAGVERRAPRWMVTAGLEWGWRLLMDPRGKWKRYLIGNPLFAWRVARAKIGQLQRSKSRAV